jgi:hypothetical protein
MFCESLQLIGELIRIYFFGYRSKHCRHRAATLSVGQ